MPWATLIGTKRWLVKTDTTDDTELNDIIAQGHRRLIQFLRNWTSDAENLSADLTNELIDIEDQLCAGMYRARRWPDELTKDGVHVWEKAAFDRAERFAKTHFGQSVFKLALQTVKGAVLRSKTSGIVVKW